jgi:Fe-S-cluster-containing dehydrogenase component/anaerobic selenocysteine-containing dehydrogenase
MKKQNNNENIWVGKKDLKFDEEFVENSMKEFVEVPFQENSSEPLSAFAPSRRDFLKVLGFGIGAATIASCDIPVKKAIPYVIKPEEIVPGVATYYASSFVKGGDYCSIVVKTREGRPIKIEGNKLSQVTFGGTSARVQADVLNLYNINRLKEPKVKKADKFEVTSWKDLDDSVKSKLNKNSKIRIVTNTILSPTRKKVISDFTKAFPNTKTITYDPYSSAAILIANEKSFGKKEIPDYKFDKADVIVSFNADFLGTWISPVEYSKKYSLKRKIENVDNPVMSRHIQVESYMSMTGSNADNRILIKPSELGSAILFLYNEIARLAGGQQIANADLNEKAKISITALAKELSESKGRSLIISGSNNIGEQIIVNKINSMLNSYGSTIDFTEASYQRQGDERELFSMIDEINNGNIDALVFLESNPMYDFAGKEKLKTALSKVKLKVALAFSMDETSNECDYIAPVSHLLESWGDAMPKKGHYSLIQPAISTIFNTRQAEISLMNWSGTLNQTADQPYYTYLKDNWKQMFPQSDATTFSAFWDKSLKEGVYYKAPAPVNVSLNADLAGAAALISKPSKSGMDLAFFETVNIGNGQYAENPWLQEMPNPVDRTAWGNHLHIPVSFNGDKDFFAYNKLEDGDIVMMDIKGIEKKLTVVSIFGQMKDTFAVPVGYGRKFAGLVGTGIGVDFNELLVSQDGLIQYYLTDVKVGEKIGEDKEFAHVQYHHTIGVTAKDNKTNEIKNADESALPDPFWKNVFGVEGFQGALTERSVIFKSNIKELKESVEHLKEKRKEFQHLNEKQIYNGYDDLYAMGHHWGMHIDTNLCTGCGTCTIACMAENNVPVVGKHEVKRHHEMAWLRIDRYFYGDVDNPNTVYQPMLCQHCDNAPCENVCPVNATNHSSEGLNQMIYNRCIGTRYCANNCPYKVRRFNWLDYTKADIFYDNEPGLQEGNKFSTIGNEDTIFGNDPLTRMVLNPDVTVRSRGVIEKCSFCVQRIQAGKLTSKVEGRKLKDEDVATACQAACPTNAIVFGDMNDKENMLNKVKSSPLTFIALEETNVRSSVSYSMKVNNRNEKFDV